MKLEKIKLDKSLNKAYFKQSLKRENIDLFKKNFKQLFERIDNKESEEHNKNIISDFLKDTYYKGKYEINTSGTKLKLAGATQSFSFYTVGGEDPVSGLDKTKLDIGGRRLDGSNQWTEDVIYEIIQNVMNSEGKFGLKIGKTKKKVIDEMNGYETVGYVILGSDTIKIIYYLFLIDQYDTYGIRGWSNMEFDNNLELFREISKTFKRKR